MFHHFGEPTEAVRIVGETSERGRVYGLGENELTGTHQCVAQKVERGRAPGESFTGSPRERKRRERAVSQKQRASRFVPGVRIVWIPFHRFKRPSKGDS